MPDNLIIIYQRDGFIAAASHIHQPDARQTKTRAQSFGALISQHIAVRAEDRRRAKGAQSGAIDQVARLSTGHIQQAQGHAAAAHPLGISQPAPVMADIEVEDAAFAVGQLLLMTWVVDIGKPDVLLCRQRRVEVGDAGRLPRWITEISADGDARQA